MVSLPLSDYTDDILNFLNEDVINGKFRQLHLRYTQDGKCRVGFGRVECGASPNPIAIRFIFNTYKIFSYPMVQCR
ncbi:MAG: hypothetical protein H6573_35070 [Lewinellaceae bacterium]|nr:hypothetical protein [Lewinellaceae bacterium]